VGSVACGLKHKIHLGFGSSERGAATRAQHPLGTHVEEGGRCSFSGSAAEEAEQAEECIFAMVRSSSAALLSARAVSSDSFPGARRMATSYAAIASSYRCR
jgi:hypothetical protein